MAAPFAVCAAESKSRDNASIRNEPIARMSEVVVHHHPIAKSQDRSTFQSGLRQSAERINRGDSERGEMAQIAG